MSGIFMAAPWCEFWSFWIAIFVGLQGWFLLTFGRMIHFVTTGTVKCFFWYLVFIVSATVLVAPNDVFGYEFEAPYCVSSLRSRISVSVWLIMWTLVLFSSLAKLCNTSRPGIEYDHITWSCLWGFLFMVPISGASLAYEDDEHFFHIHVLNISAFHLLMTLRIRWPALWFAYLAPKKTRLRYIDHFETTTDAKYMDYRSVFEAKDDLQIMQKYLAFVAQKDTNVVKLYCAVKDVAGFAYMGSSQYADKFNDDIYRAYFSNEASIIISPEIVCEPTTPLPDLLHGVLSYMHRHYDRQFFGTATKIKRFFFPCSDALAKEEAVFSERGVELDSDFEDDSSYSSFSPSLTRMRNRSMNSNSDIDFPLYLPSSSSSADDDDPIIYTNFEKIDGA